MFPITGRVYNVLLAPLTALVIVQADDNFVEAFIPRNEAEKLRIGNEVVVSSCDKGLKIRTVPNPLVCCRS